MDTTGLSYQENKKLYFELQKRMGNIDDFKEVLQAALEKDYSLAFAPKMSSTDPLLREALKYTGVSQINLIKTLLEAGADPNLLNGRKQNVLIEAIWKHAEFESICEE